MQEVNPIPTPVVTPQVVVEQPKQNNFITILLSVLLLIAVSIAGFFAYQTQKLVKELTLLRTEPTSVATSESVVSSELTFEQDKTLDPTADWKTYTNTDLGFELKYPVGFSTTKNLIPNNGIQITFVSENRDILFIKRTNINPITNKEFESLEEFDPRIKSFKKTLIGKNEAWDSGTYTTQGDTTQRDLVIKNTNSIWIIQDIQKLDNTSTVFDQILSTFKFTN